MKLRSMPPEHNVMVSRTIWCYVQYFGAQGVSLNKPRVTVTSLSFAKNQTLISELMDLNVAVTLPDPSIVRFSEDEVANFLSKSAAEIAIVGTEPINENVLKQNPQLKLIARYGVGLDNLDLPAIESRHVKIGWTAGVNKRAVSELAITFALGHIRKIFSSSSHMKNGKWLKDGGISLSACKVGIVGLGSVGSDFAELLKFFDCEIFYNDIVDKSELAQKLQIKYLNYHDLIKTCDIISFHVPTLGVQWPN